MKTIISELNRRNVTRVALFYAAASWLLIQISETVLPAFDVPGWVLRFIILLLAFGFLPVIAFSWIYEITPEGIKKEKDIEQDESITRETGRKLDVAVIITLAITIGVYLWFGNDDSQPARETQAAEQVVSVSPEPSPAEPIAALVKGVAVLPFENLSDKQENAYFASGVHEDILTHLSAVKDFRVISRTSVKQYIGTTKTMPAIATELGVSHIVEGSVRRAGNKVRITVQLIDGTTDQHIWAQNYDRQLDDIFEIQSEIARNIARQIKQELTPQELAFIDRSTTSNTAAYDYYLQARNLVFDISVRSSTVLEEPLRLTRLAIAEDPDYLDAWVQLVRLCATMYWWNELEYQGCAKDSVEQVARIAPGSPELSYSQAVYHYYIERDSRKALNLLEPVAVARPNNIEVLEIVGYTARRLQVWTSALDALHKVTLLTPQYPSAHEQYIVTLMFSGDWQFALVKAKEATQRFPDNALMAFFYADLKRRYLGDMEGYPEMMQSLTPQLRLTFGDVFIEGAFDSDEERLAWLEETIALSPESALRYKATQGQLKLFRSEGQEKQAEQQGQELINQAFKGFKKQLGEDWQKHNSVVLAILAYSAAMAMEHDFSQQVIDAYFAMPNIDQDTPAKFESLHWIVYAYAAMDKHAQAWQLVEGMLNIPGGWTPWDLKHDLRAQYFFSEHPEYQKLTQNLVVSTSM